MNKRGQLSLFIILGLVVVIIIGFIFFFRDSSLGDLINTETDQSLVNSRLEPIKNKVIGCVEKSSLKGVELIGKQGGLLSPVAYEKFDQYNVSYGCFKSGSLMVNQIPMLQDLDSELQKYLSQQKTTEEINKCINSFKEFETQGLNVDEKGSMNIVANVLEEKITLQIKYPLEITKGEVTAPINEMQTELPVGLGKAHRIALDIVNAECNNENYDFDALGLYRPVVTSSVQGYNGDKIIYLTTIPNTYREIPIEFNFIIDK